MPAGDWAALWRDLQAVRQAAFSVLGEEEVRGPGSSPSLLAAPPQQGQQGGG
jgi:hypothetical protein